jgi:hypothetical protein
MRRRRIILFLALVTMAAGVAWFWPRGPAEPVYHGKRLSLWIEESGHGQDPQTERQAREAVRAVGTNALPFLLAQFTRSESRLALRLNRWLSTLRKTDFRFDTGWNHIFIGAKGIALLGSNAAPVLPILAAHLTDQDRGAYAAWAMSGCGEPALPYLLKAAASTNGDLAFGAVQSLGNLAKNTPSAIPPLIQLLKSTNWIVQSLALSGLGDARSRPDLVVPALVEALADRNRSIRIRAEFALGRLEAVAKPAVPDLLKLLKDSDRAVAREASNALLRIDPSALLLSEK